MFNVQLLKQADRAVEEFQRAYSQRYGHPPVLNNPIELQLFLKSLINKMSADRVTELIQHFLKNDGDRGFWRLKGHSPKTFQFEIEAINASFALTKKSAERNPPLNSGQMIRIETQCPNCKKWGNIICKPSEVDKHAHTTLCKGCRELV